jgi:hypothetical protein
LPTASNLAVVRAALEARLPFTMTKEGPGAAASAISLFSLCPLRTLRLVAMQPHSALKASGRRP